MAFICACVLYGQETTPPIVKYSHPVLTSVNKLVAAKKFKQAIDLSLEQAKQMKAKQDWEGYMSFMLRAAEIETFEVWKARGLEKSEIQVDYQRPLAYLDTLQRYAGKFVNDYPSIKANILFTTAVIYSWLNLPDDALRIHLQALALRAKIFGKNSSEVADSYLWLGVLYNWGLLRRDIAKQYFLMALELQKKYMPESRYALGSTYYGLSIIAREDFDLDEAEAMSKEYSSLYYDLPYEIGLSYQLFANIYSVQGNFEKALELRLASIQIHEASSHAEELIIEYGYLSKDYENLGQYNDARNALKKGLDVLETSRNKDPFYAKALYEKFGDLYLTMQMNDSAEYFYQKALIIVKNNFGEHNDDIAVIYGSLGKLFVAKFEYKKGIDHLQKMLSSVVPNFRRPDIFSIPKVQNENPYFLTIITADFNKGDAFLAWYNQDKDAEKLEWALKNYRAAYQQLMEARKKIGDEISKPILMQNFERSIERSIQCAKLLYLTTKRQEFYQDVFKFMEITKYMNVLDALHRAERADNSGVPKELIVQLDDIKNKLADIQKKILSSTDVEKDSLAKLNNAALTLIQRRRQVMTEVTAYPAYNTASLDSMLLEVVGIQHHLSNEDQVLEYFWGTDSVYILSITKQSTDITAMTRNAETDNLFIAAYRQMRTPSSLKEEDVKNYSAVTSSLFNIFFKSIIKKKKLIIIPDGPLNLLSIEALVTNDSPEKTSFSTLDYLIYHNEITYAYSASILFKNYGTGDKKIKNVLAFSYSNGADSPSFAQRGEQGELPGAFKELEALSRLFKNVTKFINTEASKSNFLNNASGYDIIHLAIHGIGDQEVTDNSRLIFRGDSTASEALYAYEIYNLKLHAELIVLSACESGVGRNQTGEGMFSIARAFTYAGCPSMVISRWQVNDTFTSELMTYFYENLDKNESISGSLRNAKLKFLKEADGLIAHPSNWAAFVVNGQDTTFHDKSIRWYWFVVAFLLLIIGAIIYAKKDSINTLIRKRHGG